MIYAHPSLTLLHRELDFTCELQNMHDVRDNLIKGKIDVIVPSAVPALCTPHIMVMEFIEGFKVRPFH